MSCWEARTFSRARWALSSAGGRTRACPNAGLGGSALPASLGQDRSRPTVVSACEMGCEAICFLAPFSMPFGMSLLAI